MRGQFYIPTSHFSERFLFRTVFSPEAFYSERSFLRTVFSPLIRKAYNPKGHCSENFNSEMPLFRKVFDTKVSYSGFYPERFLIRTVLIPKGRFSEIRNKNLSDQKPFGLKNFMMSKNSPKPSYSPGFSICHGCLRELLPVRL